MPEKRLNNPLEKSPSDIGGPLFEVPEGMNLFERDTFHVHGQTIEFYGIFHHSGVFETKIWKSLCEAIKQSSLVILEAAPNAGRLYDRAMYPTYREVLAKYISVDPKEVSDQEMYEALIQDPFLSFFSNLEHIAAQNGKRIATIDPMASTALGSVSRAVGIDDTVNLVNLLALSGGTIGIGCSAILLNRIKKEEQQQQQEPIEQSEVRHRTDTQPLLSRRDFLRRAGKTSLGLSLFTTLFSGSSLLASASLRQGGLQNKDNPLRTILYESVDFRDIMIARGIELLVDQEVHSKQPHAMIYGAYHKGGIGRYLDSPRARSIKKKLYQPYYTATHPTLRVFSFNNKTSSWKKDKEIPIP